VWGCGVFGEVAGVGEVFVFARLFADVSGDVSV